MAHVLEAEVVCLLPAAAGSLLPPVIARIIDRFLEGRVDLGALDGLDGLDKILLQLGPLRAVATGAGRLALGLQYPFGEEIVVKLGGLLESFRLEGRDLCGIGLSSPGGGKFSRGLPVLVDTMLRRVLGQLEGLPLDEFVDGKARFTPRKHRRVAPGLPGPPGPRFTGNTFHQLAAHEGGYAALQGTRNATGSDQTTALIAGHHLTRHKARHADHSRSLFDAFHGTALDGARRCAVEGVYCHDSPLARSASTQQSTATRRAERSGGTSDHQREGRDRLYTLGTQLIILVFDRLLQMLRDGLLSPSLHAVENRFGYLTHLRAVAFGQILRGNLPLDEVPKLFDLVGLRLAGHPLDGSGKATSIIHRLHVLDGADDHQVVAVLLGGGTGVDVFTRLQTLNQVSLMLDGAAVVEDAQVQLLLALWILFPGPLGLVPLEVTPDQTDQVFLFGDGLLLRLQLGLALGLAVLGLGYLCGRRRNGRLLALTPKAFCVVMDETGEAPGAHLALRQYLPCRHVGGHVLEKMYLEAWSYARSVINPVSPIVSLLHQLLRRGIWAARLRALLTADEPAAPRILVGGPELGERSTRNACRKAPVAIPGARLGHAPQVCVLRQLQIIAGLRPFAAPLPGLRLGRYRVRRIAQGLDALLHIDHTSTGTPDHLRMPCRLSERARCTIVVAHRVRDHRLGPGSVEILGRLIHGSSDDLDLR